MSPVVLDLQFSLKTYLYDGTFIYKLLNLHLQAACCLCAKLPFRNAFFFKQEFFWSQSDVSSQTFEISSFSKPPLDPNTFLDPHFI